MDNLLRSHFGSSLLRLKPFCQKSPWNLEFATNFFKGLSMTAKIPIENLLLRQEAWKCSKTKKGAIWNKFKDGNGGRAAYFSGHFGVDLTEDEIKGRPRCQGKTKPRL